MMLPMAAIGLFCEDVREEKQGTDTLVGVLPDNMIIQSSGQIGQSKQAVFPKLALYVRINLHPDTIVDTLKVKLRTPDKTVLDLNAFEKELIERSKREVSGGPFFGLISKVVFGQMPMPIDGRFEAIVELNGHETICGFLTVRLQKPDAQG